VRSRLIGLLHTAPHEGTWHVLLACFPEEQHELGVLGAALWLRHSGGRETVLGARTPAADVVRMACELKVDGVGLSAVVDPGARAFEDTLTIIREGLPAGMPVWVGGPVARLHPEVCTRLGVSTLERAADLPRLLRG
jgi:methylmalonyl-CoA mutase cobalamin-binding subunit